MSQKYTKKNSENKINFQEIKKLREAEAAEAKSLSDEMRKPPFISWILSNNKNLMMSRES